MKPSPKIRALLAPFYLFVGLYYLVILVIEWNKPKNAKRRESLE
jgi:predicted transporter